MTVVFIPPTNSCCHTTYLFLRSELILAITSHYIDKNFNLCKDLLSFHNVPTSHTGANLASHIFDILHKFNIHTKLFCITTDSTSNNGKMMKELAKLLRKHDSIKWNGPAHHIRCLTHVINLAVKAFLSNLKIAPLREEHEWMSRKDTLDESDVQTDNDDEPDNDDIVDDDESGANFEDNSDNEQEIDNIDEYDIDDTNDFRSILQKIRTISKAATVTQKRLLSFQSHCHAAKLKPLCPIRDHTIQWSATFNMLERALYLKCAIDI